jgi:dihydroneopterin aldolase
MTSPAEGGSPGPAADSNAELRRGLRFFGRHGNNESERRLGSHFTVDLEVAADVAAAAASDRLEDGLDYSRLYELVRQLTEDHQFHLLETLASRIAEAVLALPRAERVLVRVTKEPRRPAQTVGFAVELRRP